MSWRGRGTKNVPLYTGEKRTGWLALLPAEWNPK